MCKKKTKQPKKKKRKNVSSKRFVFIGVSEVFWCICIFCSFIKKQKMFGQLGKRKNRNGKQLTLIKKQKQTKKKPKMSVQNLMKFLKKILYFVPLDLLRIVKDFLFHALFDKSNVNVKQLTHQNFKAVHLKKFPYFGSLISTSDPSLIYVEDQDEDKYKLLVLNISTNQIQRLLSFSDVEAIFQIYQDKLYVIKEKKKKTLTIFTLPEAIKEEKNYKLDNTGYISEFTLDNHYLYVIVWHSISVFEIIFYDCKAGFNHEFTLKFPFAFKKCPIIATNSEEKEIYIYVSKNEKISEEILVYEKRHPHTLLRKWSPSSSSHQSGCTVRGMHILKKFLYIIYPNQIDIFPVDTKYAFELIQTIHLFQNNFYLEKVALSNDNGSKDNDFEDRLEGHDPLQFSRHLVLIGDDLFTLVKDYTNTKICDYLYIYKSFNQFI